MGSVKKVWKNIASWWTDLSKYKKITLIILLFSVLTAVLVYSMRSNKTEYVPLFTKLDLQSSSKIVASLDDRGYTNYKLGENGTAILVPEKDVDRLRLDLAIDGALPDSGAGFELFDEAGYAMTDADRQILYQRALQGELERSIESLAEVSKARVHLALSEESIFMREKRPATASIILTLESPEKQSLSPEQIRGIISLVSGAVKNLPEENVRIVDSQANLLSAGVLEEEDPYQFPAAASRFLEREKEFENRLRNDLKGMLEQVFGPEKVAVAVRAELDFDSEESTVISYDPEGVIRSQQIRINQSSGTETGEGGSPIDSNTQNYADDNVERLLENGVSSYESITNNEIGETTIYTRKAPGEVKRISASVVYDGFLSPAEELVMENIAMAAIGYDEERGDIIHIAGVPFDTSLQDQLKEHLAEEKARQAEQEALEEQKNQARRQFMLYAFVGLLALASIAIILGLIFHGRKKKKKKKEELPAFDHIIQEPVPVEELLRQPLIDLEAKENEEIRRLKEYARENPDDMADLLRAWLLEDEG
ncbi:MAG: flagellar M-ring protein FliF [Clostridiales bacterium]|nr:flagellar M-ring protein FliF [Clostridiales bacterium]